MGKLKPYMWEILKELEEIKDKRFVPIHPDLWKLNHSEQKVYLLLQQFRDISDNTSFIKPSEFFISAKQFQRACYTLEKLKMIRKGKKRHTIIIHNKKGGLFPCFTMDFVKMAILKPIEGRFLWLCSCKGFTSEYAYRPYMKVRSHKFKHLVKYKLDSEVITRLIRFNKFEKSCSQVSKVGELKQEKSCSQVSTLKKRSNCLKQFRAFKPKDGKNFHVPNEDLEQIKNCFFQNISNSDFVSKKTLNDLIVLTFLTKRKIKSFSNFEYRDLIFHSIATYGNLMYSTVYDGVKTKTNFLNRFLAQIELNPKNKIIAEFESLVNKEIL